MHIDGRLSPESFKNNAVITNLAVSPIPISPFARAKGVIYSALQRYERTMPGQVKTHTEMEVDGFPVDEIYFPLIGKFNAKRGNEESILKGRIKDRYVLEHAKYDIEYHPEENTFTLSIRSPDGKVNSIEGFVIPGGVEHATSAIEGNNAIFFAIKVKNAQRIESNKSA